MKRAVEGNREEESGLYCGDCAAISFGDVALGGTRRKVMVDIGERCVGCRAVVVEEDGDERLVRPLRWRAPTNLERMAFAVEKAQKKPAKQRRCKCRAPRHLCKCAGAK